MGSDAPPASPGPVVLRVKLRYADLASFIDKFAVNVGQRGMFLPTRAMQPVGTELRFELRLLDDQVVLTGLGRVCSVHEAAEADPTAAHGMAIEFQRMTRESRDLVMQMLEHRRNHGLGEPALPSPEPVVAPQAAPATAEGAGKPEPAAEVAIGEPAPALAVATSEPAPALAVATSEPAPAVSTGEPARAVPSPAPLGAEPSRLPRRQLSELLASAAVPAATPQPVHKREALDQLATQFVDLARARARARQLAQLATAGAAGAASEASALDQLLRPPPPVAVDVMVASAELARQLGGPAVATGRGRRAEAAVAAGQGSASPAPAQVPGSAATGAAPSAPSAPSPSPSNEGARGDPAEPASEDDDPAPRRRRVSRPPRLTRPTSVFARGRASGAASPSPAEDPAPAAHGRDEPPSSPALLDSAVAAAKLATAATEPAPTRSAAPKAGPAPDRAFDRVLAELEEHEDARGGNELDAAQPPASPTSPTLPAPSTSPASSASPTPISQRWADASEDPLDQLALEDLEDSAELGGVTLPPAAPWRDAVDETAPLTAADLADPADVLDLGTLGEAGFEILAEEDLDDALAQEALGLELAAEPAGHHRAAAALAAAVEAPSWGSGASIAVPTWRRTTGFDPLDGPVDTAHGVDLAPPTIPGRIPTREIDLESALEALDLDADGPTMPGKPSALGRARARALVVRPSAAVAPSAGPGKARVAVDTDPDQGSTKPGSEATPALALPDDGDDGDDGDDAVDDVPIELEFED